MTFAHKGIELKPIPYVEPETPPEGEAVVADAAAAAAEEEANADASARPVSLSAGTTERLIAIEGLLARARSLKPVAALAPAPLAVSDLASEGPDLKAGQPIAR